MEKKQRLNCPFCRSTDWTPDHSTELFYYYRCLNLRCGKIFKRKRYVRRCKSCKSSNIKIWNISDKQYMRCFDCGYDVENPIKIRRKCPSCNSIRTVDINEILNDKNYKIFKCLRCGYKNKRECVKI